MVVVELLLLLCMSPPLLLLLLLLLGIAVTAALTDRAHDRASCCPNAEPTCPMSFQSPSPMRRPGESVSTTRPPSLRCHIGWRSKGWVAVNICGPSTVLPFHASSHCPGGIQTALLLTFAVMFHIGATSVSFRKTY